MKRILKIILTFAFISALLYQFWPYILTRVLDIKEVYVETFFAPAPCTHPIPYVLSTFDKKFNISQSYFLSALADAEAIWEKPFGKNLFTYDPASTSRKVLRINLIYDYRQEATSKLATLGIVVENNQASYDDLKTKFTVLQKNYNEQKSVFDKSVDVFNAKNQTYKVEVDSWNSKGGAPQDVYDKLNQERLGLNAESVELKNTQNNLNNMADEVNALVVALNRLVDSLNLSVKKYNTTSSARGESFDEGVYSSNGADVNEIDIYEFSSRAKLVRVLAHELGHALGLDHVKDPKAIMYSYNKSSNSVLTKADLTALNAKCEVKQ